MKLVLFTSSHAVTRIPWEANSINKPRGGAAVVGSFEEKIYINKHGSSRILYLGLGGNKLQRAFEYDITENYTTP